MQRPALTLPYQKAAIYQGRQVRGHHLVVHRLRQRQSKRLPVHRHRQQQLPPLGHQPRQQRLKDLLHLTFGGGELRSQGRILPALLE